MAVKFRLRVRTSVFRGDPAVRPVRPSVAERESPYGAEQVVEGRLYLVPAYGHPIATTRPPPLSLVKQ